MSGEKTELPSQKRLKDARAKGQVARSRLASATASLLGASAAGVLVAPWGWAKLLAWTSALFSAPAPAMLGPSLLEGVQLLAVLCAVPMMGACVGGLAAAVAQAGLEFHPEQVAPKLERIDLVKGFKQVFSKKRLLETLKGVLVSLLLAWVVWFHFEDAAPLLLSAARLGSEAASQVIFQHLVGLLWTLIFVLCVLSIADYLLARRSHVKELMMSREELLREHKESEGDPHLKGHRRQLQRALAQGGVARGVQKATVVVVNPTHIAVALRYAEDECEAPYIVAKGREQDALRMRREAALHKVPIIRDIPLARSLVRYDVGEEIPEELYRAAAVVLKAAAEARSADVSSRSEM